ncbi:MAG: divalent-cation tolerance protein CutA [Balneolales bacterium]
MSHVFVYITTSDTKEAKNISNVIIQEHLVACTNIIENMSSSFHWKDSVQKEQEVILIAKTTAKTFPLLEARIKELHSYDCPCIIALPIIMGNREYLDWIDKEVQQIPKNHIKPESPSVTDIHQETGHPPEADF